MKKLICLILVLVLGLSVVSCTADTGNGEDSGSNETESYIETSGRDDQGGNDQGGNDQGGNDQGGNDQGGSNENGGKLTDNQKVAIKEYIRVLTSGYSFDPESIIPNALRPGNIYNLVDKDDIITDYSSTVNVSNISNKGVGEQWKMVTDNLSQSQVFFEVLNKVEAVITSTVVAYNNYLDTNPEATARYAIKDGIYSVTIDCTETTVYYVIDFEYLGFNAQIALTMDIDSGVKTVRIQLSDANALTYTIDDNSYVFAIKYLGIRRAMFSVEVKADGSIVGHIYEYMFASLKESVADFYITNSYVTVVGNKADDMVAFDGYICEVYNTSSGRLLGYEVRETLSLIGFTAASYDTLWLNLYDVDGINYIRDEDDEEFYINNSSTQWESKDYGGGLFEVKRASRRFDIEYRTQYFYYYDAEKGEVKELKAEVPMFFVQEEKIAELEADVEEVNDISVELAISDTSLSKILSDYDVYVDVLIQNKEIMNSDTIVSFIGDRVVFS